MRNREKYQILHDATNDDWHLFVDGSLSHDGETYIIRNSHRLFSAIKIIQEFDWGTIENEVLNEKINNSMRKAILYPARFTNEEHELLVEWLDYINNHLQNAISVLETTFSEQDAYTISIKLPIKEIKSLAQLNKFNDELVETLDKFVLKRYNGTLEFGGFDTGTNWIDLVITGLEDSKRLTAYAGVLGIILIAQQGLELRKKYYESEEARYHALIAKRQLDDKKKQSQLSDITEKDFKAYVEELVKMQVRAKIEELCSATGLDNDNEAANSFEKAIPQLEKHMEKGAEYHASLSPPKEVISKGKKEINYDGLKQYLAKERKKQLKEKDTPKALPNKNEKNQKTENDNE